MFAWIRLVLNLTDAIAKWYILRALTMAAPRHYKNRRKNDPMNFRVGPHGAAVRVDSDNATPSTILVTFNCPVDASRLDIAAWLLDGNNPDGPPTQTTTTTVTVTTAAPTGSATPANILWTNANGFGPNITPIESILYINVA